MNWIKAGGQVLQGLVKRREKEWAVYVSQAPRDRFG
jgi:GH24 family phage-related lysozyme (muramidase)